MATRHESKRRTLRDLLSADRTRTRPSEQQWAALVHAIAGGDTQALYTLYEQSHRLVFTLMVRILNDRGAAEEGTVDVFHDVWRRAATYDPASGSVLAWIANQARSRAIDRLRFDQRKKRVRAEGDELPVAAPATDPHDILDVRQQGEVLRQALAVLTPAEREIIETAFFGELTYREAAARLNQPLGTVKTRMRSALAKLREALNTRQR
ncbi:MAG: sigma-70 family RNA polymerase sigma factor [Candidatus Binatia bacterium]